MGTHYIIVVFVFLTEMTNDKSGISYHSFFFIRNPIMGHDNRLMSPDNGVQYIVVSFLLGPVGFA